MIFSKWFTFIISLHLKLRDFAVNSTSKRESPLFDFRQIEVNVSSGPARSAWTCWCCVKVQVSDGEIKNRWRGLSSSGGWRRNVCGDKRTAAPNESLVKKRRGRCLWPTSLSFSVSLSVSLSLSLSVSLSLPFSSLSSHLI